LNLADQLIDLVHGSCSFLGSFLQALYGLVCMIRYFTDISLLKLCGDSLKIRKTLVYTFGIGSKG